MKTTRFTIVFLLTSLFCQAQITEPQETFDANAPAFKFETEIINYGKIENSSRPDWTGYKAWKIGGKEIIYGKWYYRKKFLIEELQISNAEYKDYLIIE